MNTEMSTEVLIPVVKAARRLANINVKDLRIFNNVPVWTPEINSLATAVAHWVRCDHPGAVVYGIQRIGKSDAATYLETAVPLILGGSTIAIKWSVEIANMKGETECIRDFLSQSGSKNISASKVGILKQRLYDHLIALADAHGADRIMLIVDEAHKLEWGHLKILMVIYNGLVDRKKQCFLMLVGEPSLEGKRDQFLAEIESLQMGGRFFFSEYQFHGIHVNDLEELLESIDEDRDITAKHMSGFFPEGFRLVDLAPLYRDAIIEIAADIGSLVPRFPMQYLRTTLNDLIYQARESRNPITFDTAWVKASLMAKTFNSVVNHYINTDDFELNEPDAPEVEPEVAR